jgi:hypothetical protein
MTGTDAEAEFGSRHGLPRLLEQSSTCKRYSTAPHGRKQYLRHD